MADSNSDNLLDDWWFFDTNCLSLLLKETTDSSREYVTGRRIIVPNLILRELRQTPELLRKIAHSLSTASLYVLPDTSRCWYADIANFLNVDRIPINVLDISPLSGDLIESYLSDTRFGTEKVGDQDQKEFYHRVTGDLGAGLDERDLCAFIWTRINGYALDWFDVNIPQCDCHPANFPSFFTFFFFYHRYYIRQSRRIENPNDFVDLMHIPLAPYCTRFHMERRFGQVLREEVKGYEPPTPFMIIKKQHKQGLVDAKTFARIKSDRTSYDKTTPLLERTEVVLFSEMRDNLVNDT